MINLRLIRLYCRKQDWAGVGFPHRLVAWTWRGIPRSIIL